MTLAELAKGIGNDVLIAENMSDAEIAGITCDSRAVQPGYLFAAIPGTVVDGHKFIPQAIEKGASAVLLQRGAVTTPSPEGVSYIHSDNPRLDFSRMAARFYGRQPTTIAAITGTNGKTSVAVFLRQIWNALGYKAGSAGTLGYHATGPDFDLSYPGSLTTPDPAELHRVVCDMQRHGVDRLAIEASSHGLDQYRLDGLDVSLAAFTNLSRDHLDYHGDEQTYLAAKTRLFTQVLREDGVAVINADVPEAPRLHEIAEDRGIRVLDYGSNADYLRLDVQAPLADGQELKLRIADAAYDLRLPLVGNFQASNVLCALTLAIASGCEITDCVKSASGLVGVRGRLECAGQTHSGARIYVDYAHTPDALKNVLQSVRPHTNKRVHVVFGCGGDRDAGKRKPMGAAATAHADKVVVTDDNPRGEDPAIIRQQALTGCSDAVEIPDRRDAIRYAIENLAPGDALVVAGKGHEQGQVVGRETRPFDDVSVVREILAEEGA